MGRYPWVLVAALAVLLVSGCYGEKTEEAEAEAAPAAEAEAAVETAVVEVALTGTEFEPAIGVDLLPPGVWYCDMGTTHYARGEKGDSPCPVCGMTLVEKAAAAEETEAAGGA